MTLHSPLGSFVEQLPPFDQLQLSLLDFRPPPAMSSATPKSPPLKSPTPRPSHSLPSNFTIGTTPGVRPEQVTVTNEALGRGSFGSVWRGVFSGCPVAVKLCPLENASTAALTQFRREMSRYHHLRHPCITQFFCVVQHTDNLLLVTELMKGGSLFQALTRLRKSGLKHLQTASMLRIAQHVTNGLAYLHASGFSFGDLKSMNVLLSEEPDLQNGAFSPSVQAKLCDFGLSRNLKHLVAPGQKHSMFDTQIPARNGPAGTFAYLAPEAFSGLPVHNASAPKAADIYALGIVLWELATLHSPWPGKQPLQLLKLVRKESRRPPWPATASKMSDGYVALVERCWHQDPSQRPTVDLVATELEAMLRMLPDHIDPQESFHRRTSFFSRTTEAETNLSSDFEALHVEDREVGEDTSTKSSMDEASYRRFAPVKYLKPMRTFSPPEIKMCSSDMSACTTAFDTAPNSLSKLTVDSLVPGMESKCLGLTRGGEISTETPKNKERRMSFTSTENGPESKQVELLLPKEAPVNKQSPGQPEYVIPSSGPNEVKSIDGELRYFEEEEDLDAQRLGISMYSRPHFR